MQNQIFFLTKVTLQPDIKVSAIGDMEVNPPIDIEAITPIST